jgi:hypothetical protein
MATITPAFVQVQPNFTDPGLLLPYTQASQAFFTLEGEEPKRMLSDGDQYVYIKTINLRTKAAAGQMAYNQLPSCEIQLGQISTPTYLCRNRAEYDHHDTAAAGRWGVAIAMAYSLAMRQGQFQLARQLLLYGANPANGEGLINAVGTTAVNLPPDTNGNTTVQTYDNGQMAFFLLNQIGQIKSRTNQLGIPKGFVILMPQRVGQQFEFNVVSLVQFQRPGAGVTSTAGTVKDVLEWNGDTIIWGYDDTLIGQGAGGNDAVIITMPAVTKPQGMTINTNEFPKLAPGIDACNVMYCDMAAPREITTPMPGGAVDTLSEWRLSSGWPVRPTATTIVSMQYM